MTARRDFLAFTAGVVVAKALVPLAAEAVVRHGAAPHGHPDAELIALAERFIAGELAVRDWPCGAHGNLPDPAFSMAVRAQDALASEMGALRATTADGVAARARCLAAHNSDFDFSMDDPDTVTGRLVHCLMRDAAALGGPPMVKPLASPDAELLEACAEFDRLELAALATFQGHEPGSAEEEAAEAERDRLSAAQDPLVARMCELRAVTHEGQAARARSLALWNAEPLKPGSGDTGACLTAAIVRDLLAGSAMACPRHGRAT